MMQVSVIVPTHGRARDLGACIRALLDQTFPHAQYEIIVVSDGSFEESAAALREFAGNTRVRLIGQPHLGPGAARNRGAQAATGVSCVFIDDDVIAARELIAEHARAQQEPDVIGVGRIDTISQYPGDGFSRCLANWLRSSYQQIERGERAPSFLDCYSGNLSVRRGAFLAAGGFATDLPRYEDIELGYRLTTMHGLRIKSLPRARGREVFRKRFRPIARDAERAGVASVDLYRRHPAMLRHLQLGKFAAPRLRSLLARRALLRLNFPGSGLAPLDRLLGGVGGESWYSFVYDYCYWRGVRSAIGTADTWRRLTHGALILSYHAIGDRSDRPGRFIVPARRFARHMRWLRLFAFDVISLRSLIECRREHRLPPPRTVVLTLDDGYTDNATQAYPLIKRFRLPATMFVVSQLVGRTNQWDRRGELANRPLLSWERLRSLRTDGLIEYGAHTRTHARLPSLPRSEARRELDLGRRELERNLDQPISVLAYPYGATDAAVEQMAQDVGFVAACGVQPGPNTAATPDYALKRTEVRGTDSLLRFALTLWLGELPRLGAHDRA